MNLKQFKTSVLIVVFALLTACDGQSQQHSTSVSEISALSIDKTLPIFMLNETNTVLYDQATADSTVIARLSEENNQSLICLSAVKDAHKNTWYKCYYPREQVEGWTRQVSPYDVQGDEKTLPFLQNFTLAQLQLGANPREAKRLLGKPLSELTEEGPVDVSGYIDDEHTVTTTTLEFDGIRLIYENERMIHAYLNKPSKSFGWITCGGKGSDKSSLLKKFKLTEDDVYINDEGDTTIIMGGFLTLTVLFDNNELVKTIEFNTGP
ncbi:MAG: hypothetical protein M0Q98_14445 [Pseudomonas sp.]|jgi:hypothetical protein|nr:hypothetical protein [Pseudomonas sp.]MDY0413324.1 hypothetical protein [Pseudomonas sp.]